MKGPQQGAGNGLPPAPLHLLKMAVGAGSLDELRAFRAARFAQHGASWVFTRNHPRRGAQVIDGGSLYWVIRGQIQVRQRVTGFSTARDDKDRTYCRIEVDRELVPTRWRPWRPFQGWRYLSAADAPADLATALPGDAASAAADEAMPAGLLAELRALGLL